MKGAELRRIRTRLGLTQAQLAQRIGVTSNTVARWERDEVAISEAMSRLIRVVITAAARGRDRRGRGKER